MQAQEDLRTAEANLQIKKYYAAAFFSQQASEKALKAVAVAMMKEKVRTHNLVELSEIVKLPQAYFKDIADLNADYTIARYPDAANGVPYKQYTLQIAERKTKCSKKIVSWAEKWLQK